MERRLASRAPLVIALAASATIAPTASSAQTSSGAIQCNPAWPVVAHRAGGQIVAPPAATALPIACAAQTGFPSSESTLAQTNTGTLIYSPALSENSLARSADGGATWSLTYPPDEQYTALWNTDDPYVIADRTTGRVFWAHATGPTRTTPLLVSNSPLPINPGTVIAAASGFQVYASRDDGRSYTTADYSTAPMGDWEKLSVGPPPPAAGGAAQPSGYPNIVYICANSPLEVSGPGRLCYKSLDGGTTFAIAGYVSPSVGQPQDVCPPLNFNPAVIDRSGTAYTPVDCQQSAYIAISHDEFASETWLALKDAPTGGLTGGFVQLAVDDADNLYALWPKNGQLFLSISRDHARSWGTPLSVAAPGLHNVQRPTIAAGARGQVGIAYYASSDPSAQLLSAYITQTHDALDAAPIFYSGALNDPARPIFKDYGLSGGSPRLDFIGGSYDSPGTTFWAGVVKQFGPKDSQGNIPTTGYAGTLAAGVAASAPGGSSLAAPHAPKPKGCVSATRLSFRVNRPRAGRVVSVSVYVNRRLVLLRRGSNVTRVTFARPAGRRLRIEIVSTSDRGTRVVARRTLRGCPTAKPKPTRTRKRGR